MRMHSLDPLSAVRYKARYCVVAGIPDCGSFARHRIPKLRNAPTETSIMRDSAMWSLLELFPEPFLIKILDIGAALSDEEPPYKALVDAGRAQVVGFEPNATECARLNATYGSSHRFLPFFVGDGRPATFHETNWTQTGSLFPPNVPLLEKFQNLSELVQPVARHPVDTVRLNDLVDIEDVDFIKIDVQGSELAVFQHATRVLPGTLLIQTEVEFVELYKNQPMFADVDRLLRQQGFQFHTFAGFGSRAFKPFHVEKAPKQGFRQHLWSDAIYVRDWMQLNALPPEKLKKFAVLAHDVLQSYDLAHLVLEALDARQGSDKAQEYRDRFNRRPERRTTSNLPMAPIDKVHGVDTNLVLKTTLGYSLALPKSLECITTYVILEQECWFEKEIAFLLKWVRPGMSALDIGANVGAYALPLAARVAPTGSVRAYEPGSDNRAYLEAGAKQNGIANLIISDAALSSRAGSCWLASGSSGELNSLSLDGQDDGAGEMVRVVTLDEERRLHSWPAIDFIKIDAEGQEARIIAGGREFFAHTSPLVMYEIKHAGIDNQGLRWMFEALGYRTYQLNGDASFLSPVGDDETSDPFTLNFFAAKPDRAAELLAAGLLVETLEPFAVTDPERDAVLGRMLELPFARELELSSDDFEVASTYHQALIAYACYRFLDCTPTRKYAALEFAYQRLAQICTENASAARLATFARVAESSHRRNTAIAALRQLREMFDDTGRAPALDEPFFPPCERFESLHFGEDGATWFACATIENIERLSAFSSLFGGLDLNTLEKMCATPYASGELLRRFVLKSLIEGKTTAYPVLGAAVGHLNAELWTDGPRTVARLRELLS